MATKDFSAKQIRASQLLASGGISGTTAGLAIYSASNASNLEGGLSDANIFSGVGSDVLLFVSGAANQRSSVSLFGGDVVISGTLYAERQVIEVDETTSGSLSVSGSLYVQQGAQINLEAGSTYPDNTFQITSNQGTSFAVYGSPADVDASQPAVYVNPANGQIDFFVKTDGAKSAIVVDAQREYIAFMSGGVGDSPGAPNPRTMSDVNFLVSGSIGGKDSTSRGVAVFGGDVVVSGSIYPGGDTETLNIGSANQAYLGVYSKEFYGDLQGSIRFAAINDEGDSISKGQVVYIKGISGQTPTVALAACDDPSKMPAFGLAATDAVDGAAVEIVTSGDLSNYNINTLYGGVFSEGDVLYVATGSNHTSGSLTNIRPKGGENLLQNMGFVVRDGGGGDSRVKVGGAGRSNATPNLNDGQIFIGDSTNSSTTASLGLNLAYASGSGAIIGVDGQPVQLQAGSSTALAVTGSIIIDDDGTNGKAEIYGDGKGYFYTYGNFAYNEPKLSFYRGRGTETSITSPAEGDDLGQLAWLGYSGGIHRTAAAIQAEADADHGDLSQDTPGRLLFKTAQDGTSTLTTRQTIKNDGTTLFNLDSTSQTDAIFIVSGTIGGKGTEGTAIFGGDVVISGSLHGGSPLQIGEYQPDVGTDVVLYVSGTTPSGGGGKGTSNGTTVLNSDLVVSGTYRGGYDPAAGSESFQAISDNYLFMSSDADFGSSQIQATDSNFFFTGSIGSRRGGTLGTAVFGGDVVVSGSLRAKSLQYFKAHQRITNNSDGLFVYHGNIGVGSVDKNNNAVQFIFPTSGSLLRVTGLVNGASANDCTVALTVFKNGQNDIISQMTASLKESAGQGGKTLPSPYSNGHAFTFDFTGRSNITVSGSQSPGFDPLDTMQISARFKDSNNFIDGTWTIVTENEEFDI